jgi:glycerate kinase
MKHILVAADKFKGSLTTFEACLHIAKGLQSVNPALTIQLFPVADGGDGFQEVMQHYLHSKTINCSTVDPLHRPMEGRYQLDAKSKTAIIEVAVASGLVLLKAEERNPLKTSTIGTGLLILDAIRHGCTTIMLGLGGSATNDAGMGILYALGYTFYTIDGTALQPCGENLEYIHSITLPDKISPLQFIIASDVQHVLYGTEGAAYVFARQKGADEAGIKQLNAGLINFSNVITRITNKQIHQVPGTGAAGGIAAGLMAFFPVEIKSGIQIVIEVSNMQQGMQTADIVFTGEGKMDEQTMTGKVIAGVLEVARELNKPVVVCCGENTIDVNYLQSKGVVAVHTLMERSASVEDAVNNAGARLEETAAAAIQGLASSCTGFILGEIK